MINFVTQEFEFCKLLRFWLQSFLSWEKIWENETIYFTENPWTSIVKPARDVVLSCRLKISDFVAQIPNQSLCRGSSKWYTSNWLKFNRVRHISVIRRSLNQKKVKLQFFPGLDLGSNNLKVSLIYLLEFSNFWTCNENKAQKSAKVFTFNVYVPANLTFFLKRFR